MPRNEVLFKQIAGYIERDKTLMNVVMIDKREKPEYSLVKITEMRDGTDEFLKETGYQKYVDFNGEHAIKLAKFIFDSFSDSKDVKEYLKQLSELQR